MDSVKYVIEQQLIYVPLCPVCGAKIGRFPDIGIGPFGQIPYLFCVCGYHSDVSQLDGFKPTDRHLKIFGLTKDKCIDAGLL